jgi:S1-C subfamily serine protease
MKYFKVFLPWILFLVIASPSLATDEEASREKILRNFQKVAAGAKIQEPTLDTPTRSPAGPKLYRLVVNAVVYVGTADGALASGAVVSNSGLIITNWHVVGGKSTVGIVFKQAIRQDKTVLKKEDVLFAKVVKIDQTRDLALLKLVSTPPGLTIVQLGSLSDVETGQDVFAISHPEGLPWSYTEGVISQIRPKYEWRSESGSVHRATMIQTQTVVSFGSSGAPLFDGNGRLIGVVVSSAGPGLNFAIAIDEVRDFILSALEKR